MLTNQGCWKVINTVRSSFKQIIETALFFHNNMKYENLQRLCAQNQSSVSACVSFRAQPHDQHLFLIWWMNGDCTTCFVCRRGMVLIDRADSIQVVCISSRKFSCRKRLINGLKSEVLIVWWTHFLPVSLPHFVFFVCFFFFSYFLSSLSFSVGKWPSFNEIHL